MSKEKSAAWRSMREVSDKDVRTMQEMHASQFLLRNEVAPRVTDDPEDARVMREMHTNRTPDPVMDNADMEGTGYRWRNAPVPEEQRTATPPEDMALAMHTLWRSDRRINWNGKWYVPLSEVADILMTGDYTEEPEPLSEEWQAKTFPNLNIGEPTPKEDSKRWFSVMDRKQRGR